MKRILENEEIYRLARRLERQDLKEMARVSQKTLKNDYSSDELMDAYGDHKAYDRMSKEYFTRHPEDVAPNPSRTKAKAMSDAMWNIGQNLSKEGFKFSNPQGVEMTLDLEDGQFRFVYHLDATYNGRSLQYTVNGKTVNGVLVRVFSSDQAMNDADELDDYNQENAATSEKLFDDVDLADGVIDREWDGDQEYNYAPAGKLTDKDFFAECQQAVTSYFRMQIVKGKFKYNVKPNGQKNDKNSFKETWNLDSAVRGSTDNINVTEIASIRMHMDRDCCEGYTAYVVDDGSNHTCSYVDEDTGEEVTRPGCICVIKMELTPEAYDVASEKLWSSDGEVDESDAIADACDECYGGIKNSLVDPLYDYWADKTKSFMVTKTDKLTDAEEKYIVSENYMI